MRTVGRSGIIDVIGSLRRWHMRVIGAGFARTGTLSLCTALETLGFGPCYHMRDVMGDGRRVRQWLGIARGAPAEWGEVFAGYHSAVDWPVAAYWRPLADAFPRAKVILTVRDPYAWYDSARSTIWRIRLDPPRGVRGAATRLLGTLSPDLRAFLSMTQETVERPIFDGRLADREHAVAVFRRHVAEVQAALPRERLLTYDVTEGWGPLCEFLDVPVPTRPFPRTNDTQSFHRTFGPMIGRLAFGPIVHPWSRRGRPPAPPVR
jgi:hypothetical protein